MCKKLNWLQLLLVFTFLLSVPIIVTNQYNMHLIIMAGIYGIITIGLDLIVGYTGLLSLAQAAFYGIGAYASALLTLRLGLSFWTGAAAAFVLTGAVSLLVGAVGLRSRGTSFIIMSFSFAGIAHLVALNWVSLTNGQMGISKIPVPVLGSWAISSKADYYYLVLAFLLLTYFLATRVTESRIGRAWIAIRENELLAESLGINPFAYCLFAFVVGSALAGLAGSLYAHYTGFISPENLIFEVMILLIVMTVMGGKGTVIGPIIGAIIFTVLPEYLRIADDYRLPIFGMILLLLTLYFPKGLVPAFRGWMTSRRTKGGEKFETA